MNVQELQRREEAVRNGKLATILFVRDFNSRRQEVSGYIDVGERLADGSMDAVFANKVRAVADGDAGPEVHHGTEQAATVQHVLHALGISCHKHALAFAVLYRCEAAPYLSCGAPSTGTLCVHVNQLRQLGGLQARLLPKMSDLSFFNWDTRASATNPSTNFQVCSCACTLCCALALARTVAAETHELVTPAVVLFAFTQWFTGPLHATVDGPYELATSRHSEDIS